MHVCSFFKEKMNLSLEFYRQKTNYNHKNTLQNMMTCKTHTTLH